jgi:hypothetical protein
MNDLLDDELQPMSKPEEIIHPMLASAQRLVRLGMDQQRPPELHLKQKDKDIRSQFE